MQAQALAAVRHCLQTHLVPLATKRLAEFLESDQLPPAFIRDCIKTVYAYGLAKPRPDAGATGDDVPASELTAAQLSARIRSLEVERRRRIDDAKVIDSAPVTDATQGEAIDLLG